MSRPTMIRFVPDEDLPSGVSFADDPAGNDEADDIMERLKTIGKMPKRKTRFTMHSPNRKSLVPGNGDGNDRTSASNLNAGSGKKNWANFKDRWKARNTFLVANQANLKKLPDNIREAFTLPQLIDFRAAFDLFDVDKNGIIDASDYQNVARREGGSVSESEAQQLILDVDYSGTGQIDFEKFLKLTKQVESGQIPNVGFMKLIQDRGVQARERRERIEKQKRATMMQSVRDRALKRAAVVLPAPGSAKRQALGLSNQRLHELQDAFTTFAKTGAQQLSHAGGIELSCGASELRLVSTALGGSLDAEEAGQLIAKISPKSHGRIDFNHFIELASKVQKGHIKSDTFMRKENDRAAAAAAKRQELARMENDKTALLVAQLESKGTRRVQVEEKVEPVYAEVQMREVFEEFDTDGDGSIVPSELQKIAQKLGWQLTHDEARELINAVDINKDGVIDFKEFQLLWKRAKEGRFRAPKGKGGADDYNFMNVVQHKEFVMSQKRRKEYEEAKNKYDQEKKPSDDKVAEVRKAGAQQGQKARFMEELNARDAAVVEAQVGRRAVGTVFQKKSSDGHRATQVGLRPMVMSAEEELLMQRRRYIAVPDKRATMTHQSKSPNLDGKRSLATQGKGDMLSQVRSYYMSEHADDEPDSFNTFYSDKALLKREALKFDPAVLEALDKVLRSVRGSVVCGVVG
jgi:Ca2+-binding EF-hand superfamily protein